VGRRDLALAFAPAAASRLELLVEGREFYPRMLDDIAAARTSVHINQFGFRPGRVGNRFADALVAKAEEGVAVRLVVDTNGSDPLGSSRVMYDRLAGVGVEVVVNVGNRPRAASGPIGRTGPRRLDVRRLGHIDHRKALVIDGRIGYVGGAGIEDHFEDGSFHDLFVRFEGSVVDQLQLVFLASFLHLGGAIDGPASALFQAHSEPDPGGAPTVVLHNAPGFRPITRAIEDLVESARSTLDVVNPYVTDRGTIRRLGDAARRGVLVRLVVPAKPNNWACGWAQRHHHPALLAAGVQIWEYPRMVHAKALVRDGEDVLVGTCNLEAWSLKRFYEIDIRTESPDLARQFEERFFAEAIAVSTAGDVDTGRRERLRNAAFSAISPLL
jgi:cardiolipin synthase